MGVRNVALAETKGMEPLTDEQMREEGLSGSDESEGSKE